MTLSLENGYWVEMMMKQNEYQASTFPLNQMRETEEACGYLPGLQGWGHFLLQRDTL